MCLTGQVTCFKCVLTPRQHTHARTHAKTSWIHGPFSFPHSKYPHLWISDQQARHRLRTSCFLPNHEIWSFLSWKVVEDENTRLQLTFLQSLHHGNPREHQGTCSQAHYAMLCYSTCDQQCTCSISLTSGHHTCWSLLQREHDRV